MRFPHQLEKTMKVMAIAAGTAVLSVPVPGLADSLDEYIHKVAVMNAEYNQPSAGELTVNVRTGVVKDEDGKVVEDLPEDIRLAAAQDTSAQAKRVLQDSEYQVTGQRGSVLTVDNPFQNRRLILDADYAGRAQKGAVMTAVYDGIAVVQYKDEDSALEVYEHLKNVCDVMPDITLHAEQLEGYNGYLSYGVEMMGFNEIQTRFAGHEDELETVVVAVLDSGLEDTDGALYGRVIEGDSVIPVPANSSGESNSADPTQYMPWNTDEFGHGTHVAGIVADCTQNNIKILPIRIMDEHGSTNAGLMLNGVRKAMSYGADVVSLSLSGNAPGAQALQIVENFFQTVKDQGVAVVVASGNNNRDASNIFPACLNNVLTIGAIDSTKIRFVEDDSHGSNYGYCLDFVAPGARIKGLQAGGGVTWKSGTSMATPHISAAVATLKMLNPAWTQDDVADILKDVAEDLGMEGKDTYYGDGLPVLTDFHMDEALCQNHLIVEYDQPGQGGNTAHIQECLKCTYKTVVVTGDHVYGEPTWSWADDNTSATATFTCSHCDNVVTLDTTDITERVDVPAGCEQPGQSSYVASVMFESQYYYGSKPFETSPKGHMWEETSRDSSSCTENWKIYYECSSCHQTREDEFQPVGHDYEAVVVGPTCGTQGYTRHTCSRCGDFYDDTYTEPLYNAHVWTETTRTPATCTTVGSVEYACENCDAERIERLEMLPHNAVDAERIEPGCETEGREAGRYCGTCNTVLSGMETIEPLGHAWGGPQGVPATCTANGHLTYTCTRCQAERTEILPAVSHNFETIPAVAVTCETDGYTAGLKCSMCQTVFTAPKVIPAPGHTWDAGVITRHPDCTTDGVKTYTCSVCHGTKEEAIKATGHTEQILPAIPATCTEDGLTEGRKCSVCQTVTQPQTTVKAKGHTAVVIPAVPATCTKDGLSEGSKCSVCGTILKAPGVVKANGHTWDSGKVTKEPSCTEEGVKTYTCTACHETRTEKVQMKAHTPVVIAAIPASCGAEGATEGSKCGVCGAVLKAPEVIPATGHTPGTPVQEKMVPATCEADGSYEEAVYCTVCKQEVSRTPVALPKTGHAWDDGKITLQPTVQNEGVKTYTCNNCQGTRTEQIAKLDPETVVTPGKDGTMVGQGASAKAADTAITSMKTDNDPKGSVFRVLRLYSTKQTNKSVTVKWTKAAGAKKYVVYGNACGKKNRMKKLKTTTKRTLTFTNVAKKAVKKGTYYKFMVVALDKNNQVISTSKVLHIATTGGKVTNIASVELANVTRGKLTLKRGKTFTLKAEAIPAVKKLKVKTHRKLCYESSKPSVASVNSSGQIRANRKGSCFIYVYSQSGTFAKMKVTVK